MFVKQSEFEKQIKKAYKNGCLRVFMDFNEDMVINTSNWTLGIHRDFITKEIKGALIKLVGDLPEKGQTILYGDDEFEQHEMNVMLDASVFEGCEQENSDYKNFCITCITLEKELRLAQAETDNKLIKIFRQKHLDLIARDLVDTKNGETQVEGPISANKGVTLKWWTTAGALEICSAISENYRNELLDMLKTIKIERYIE